jgi:hypothetical protein
MRWRIRFVEKASRPARRARRRRAGEAGCHFDCKVSKDNSELTAVRLDVCRDSACPFRLSSVDRNSRTLCSKSPRDRLSQADAATRATRDQRTLPLQSQIHSGNLQVFL